MDKDSQCKLILHYMKERGSITAKEALKLCGCMRLAARISDLKKRGIPIKSEPSYYISENGYRVRHATYSLEV